MNRKKFVATLIAVFLLLLLVVIWILFRSTSTTELSIGAVLPMTGDAAKYGRWTSQGAQLAIDEINARGGVDEHRLVLRVQDSQTNATAGTAALQHLLATDRPSVVLTTLTGVSRALIPIAELNKVVLFANATLPGLTEGHEFVFRNITSLANDVPAMVGYLSNTLSKPAVAILWRNDEFGVWGSREFERLYAKASGKVVASIPYESTVDDFRTHIGRIANGSPQAVYLLGYSPSR